MQKFKIQTLSTCNRVPTKLGFDPTIVITGGLTVAQQLFPNLFGSNRRPITDQDWDSLFPGGGYWSTLLKSYLKSRCHYDVDMKFMYPGNFGSGGSWSRGYIAQFVLENRASICPNQPDSCWSGTICQPCMTAFQKILSQEGLTGGTQPAGIFPGMSGGIDWTTIALIGGGIFLVAALTKKGKRK